MRRRRLSKRRLVAVAAGGILALVVAAFLVIYFVIFPTSSPRPLSLSSSAASVPVSSGGRLAGRWTIASGSVAGYRVREKLGFLPAEDDAVGRTSDITGDAILTERGRAVTIAKASFTVAVNTLKSDQAMRDQHIRTIGIQSDTYPTATFKLTKPVALPATALDGSVVQVPVTGIFDIHGTSRTETLPVQMRLSSSSIEAVGSLTFPWSRFNMTAPSVGGFVSVENKATMEFDLHLKPA
ncbi:MAG TPA: YceI family protein [Solirubrobacteraceae bacterium]|nr:YceI family protein [Solirubrobacteraceae bacterium]